jgi:hypothetical protein
MSTDIELPQDKAATLVSQTAAIEQARAVAEVQAAVTVAQKMPRNEALAERTMTDSCGRLAMAERAFYRVPNRGEGPTVHLARELARIWGNIDYGVRELRRDDEAGESEIQAFAWDQQTNTRTTRTFIVPHARMANKKRKRLDDLGDIYLNNQNIGARAVRECIFAVLPAPFTEQAQELCKSTLQHGEGEPLEARIPKMVAAFDGIGIGVSRLEGKLGRKRPDWTAADVATMKVTFASIKRGEVNADEEFPDPLLEVTGGES